MPFEIAAFVRPENFGFGFAFGLQSCNAIRCKQQLAFFGLYRDIVIIGMKRQPAIVRNGPRSCGPDHGRNVCGDFRGFVFAASNHAEFHPDGRADMVFVFHFGFGEGGGIERHQ